MYTIIIMAILMCTLHTTLLNVTNYAQCIKILLLITENNMVLTDSANTSLICISYCIYHATSE